MSSCSCSGNGECITQCICTCVNEETGIPLEICNCGHRNHIKIIGGPNECDVYCRINCSYDCQLVECCNYKMCEEKCPQWQLDCTCKMCKVCAVMIGRIKFFDERGNCPICFGNNDIIEISCEKHNACIDCWKKLCKKYKYFPLTCPFCSESI
jgi:hypothetical protein